jgi:hypothetical protein
MTTTAVPPSPGLTTAPSVNGDGHGRNGKPGDWVVITIDMGDAAAWKLIGLAAHDYYDNPAHAEKMIGRRAVLIPYRSRSHTNAHVIGSMLSLHRPETVDIVCIDDLGITPDITIPRWFEEQQKTGEYAGAAELLEEMGRRAERKYPAPPAAGFGNGDIVYSSLSDHEIGLVRLGDIAMMPVEWLWEYRLARGEMALLAGEGGLGKSQLLLSVAAAISTGSAWPEGSGPAPLGIVVILSAEDSPETTIKPRLVAMGADIDRIVISTARVTLERDGRKVINPVSLQNLEYWGEFFDRLPDCRLFICDPIPSYLGRGVNDQKNAEIRSVLEPFIEEILRPRGLCMFANTHLNKSVDVKTPVHRITGSIAYANIPRNVHFVVRDPDRPGRKFFKQAKCNNANEDLPALAFRIEKRLLPFEGGEIETAIPVFEAETVAVDLNHVMGSERRKPGPKTLRLDAFAEWLWGALKLSSVPVFQLVRQAQNEGLLPQPTDKVPKPSISSLYAARDRLPQLHQGWEIEETEMYLEGGNGMRAYKAWGLRDLSVADEDRVPF